MNESFVRSSNIISFIKLEILTFLYILSLLAQKPDNKEKSLCADNNKIFYKGKKLYQEILIDLYHVCQLLQEEYAEFRQ